MDFQGGSGGGFNSMNTNNNGYTEVPADTPPSSEGRAHRSRDEQTVIPVTVLMAMRSQRDPSGGDALVLDDGRKLASIKIVGATRQVQDFSTNAVYEVEDGTGLIEVKQWVDDNDCTAMSELRNETLRENVFLKIVGQIKDYDGKKIVVANSIRPLSTGNELTHHMLEVVYSAEKHRRGDAIVAPAGVGSASMGGFQPLQPISGGAGEAPGNSAKDQLLHCIKNLDGK